MPKKGTVVAALIASATLAISMTGCTQAPTGSSAADCTPEWNFETIEKGKLIVAAVGTLPYVDIRPGSSEAGGIDGSFYTEFAKRACLSVDFRSLGGPAAVAAMTEKQADVAAGGWYATPERAQSIGQTSPVWFNYNGIVSSAGLGTVDSLQGKTVGVVGGSVYVAPLEAAIGSDRVKQYQTADAILQDLKAGRIDAGVGTAVEMGYQVKARNESNLKVVPLESDEKYPELTQGGQVNFPHTKDNTDLGQALEDYIKKIQSDGTVQKVLAEYGADDAKYTKQQ
jgi:polar amino acid transport system substrate-binding protein